jgi:hypothetical protein
MVIPLGGGDKTTQSRDIATAKQLSIHCKRRKSEKVEEVRGTRGERKCRDQSENPKSEEANRCP